MKSQSHVRREPAHSVPSPQPAPALVTLNELSAILRVHVSQIVRLLPQGLPHVDVTAVRNPSRRRKAHRRFDAQEVLAWLRERSAS